jgi:8-oxo-dGTP pyrophosphatase MutT (NUDIX family)
LLSDRPEKHPITKSEVAFEGRIWNVLRETFDYPTGELTREFVAHPGAVAVVAVDDQMRVLMISQYRHPVREVLWEIPAGLRDIVGEADIDAARRELLEETGYVAASIEPLIEFYTTPGGNDEKITIFLARGLTWQGHDLELDGEEIDMGVEWVPLNEAVQSVLASKIKSPSAAVGLMALALKWGPNAAASE